MSDGQFMATNPVIIKGVASAILAGAIDKFYFKEQNMTHNASFALSTALGITIGSAIGKTIPSVIEDSTFYNGKTIAQRSSEVLFGSAISYGAFMYSGFNYTPSDYIERVGAVLVVDFASEYCVDYMTGEALQYLA